MSADVTASANTTSAKKKEKLSDQPTRELQLDNAEDVWRQVLDGIGDLTAEVAGQFAKLELADRDRLVVTLQDTYQRDFCNRADRKQRLESALENAVGQKIRIDFLAADNRAHVEQISQPAKTRRQMIIELQQNPLVKAAIEVFDAEVVDFQKVAPKSR
jgi:hypothetical protein